MTVEDSYAMKVSTARRACEALRAATADREPSREMATTVGSLSSLLVVIEELTASLVAERAQTERLVKSLRRIGTLQIRGGRAAVQDSDWKRMAGDLQAIAESALLTMTIVSRR